MNSVDQSRTDVAVLRPWPFGPPLRGRAPQRDAGTLASPRVARQALQSATSTSAPVGGLASPSLTGYVL